MSDELKYSAGVIRPASDSRHVQELTERADALAAVTDAASPVQAAIVPEGHGVALVDQEQLGAVPVRPRGDATFTELDPFAIYVNAHRGPGTTVWISHEDGALGETASPIGRIQSVLDDHDPLAGAGWGEHTATYPLVTTPQWQHWLAADGRYMKQDVFSEHLRQGLSEIREPDSSTILEAAENLVVTEHQVLKSVVRDGGDLKIEHTAEQTGRANTDRGPTEIPEVFTLRLAAFAGGEPIEITGRLKYRNGGGVLQLGYVLNRPLEALTDAIANLEAQTRALLDGSLTDRTYRGAPIARSKRTRLLTVPVVARIR